MKVIRNMSKEEFHLYTCGIDVYSNNKNKMNNTKSICFFPAEFSDEEEEYHILNVINNWDESGLIVCFDIPDEYLTECCGTYPDWSSADWFALVTLKEYHISMYNNTIAICLWYCWSSDYNRKYYIVKEDCKC